MELLQLPQSNIIECRCEDELIHLCNEQKIVSENRFLFHGIIKSTAIYSTRSKTDEDLNYIVYIDLTKNLNKLHFNLEEPFDRIWTIYSYSNDVFSSLQ